MAKSSKKLEEKLSAKKALELYKETLNLNVISRYDPCIKKLLYQTAYSVIYKFDETQENWIKTDYQGSLALYLRDFQVPTATSPAFQDLQKLFCYGLILLNRSNLDLFSIGILPNNVTNHYFPNGVDNCGILRMDVELKDSLIIVKNLLGEIYGLWIFNESDRSKLHKLLQFCLTNDESAL